MKKYIVFFILLFLFQNIYLYAEFKSFLNPVEIINTAEGKMYKQPPFLYDFYGLTLDCELTTNITNKKMTESKKK